MCDDSSLRQDHCPLTTHPTLTSAYLVLDVPHEGAEAGGGGGVRVPLHAALKELLLLRVLLQGQEKPPNIVLLLQGREYA